jgi:hypothetical protein
MGRWWIGVPVAVLVLAALLGGCSDGEPDEAAPKPSTPGEEVARSLGCTATEQLKRIGGFDERLTCHMGDRGDNLLLVFDEKHRERVERQYTAGPMTSGQPAERGVCPDGTPVPYQWSVLGPDWLMHTAHDAVKDDLVENFDGEVVRGSPWPPATDGLSTCDQTTSTPP